MLQKYEYEIDITKSEHTLHETFYLHALNEQLKVKRKNTELIGISKSFYGNFFLFDIKVLRHSQKVVARND